MALMISVMSDQLDSAVAALIGGFVRVCLLLQCGHLLGNGLTYWLSFVMSNCMFVTFPLVSWVRYGT